MEKVWTGKLESCLAFGLEQLVASVEGSFAREPDSARFDRILKELDFRGTSPLLGQLQTKCHAGNV